MFNELEIQRINKDFGFKCRVYDDRIYLTSKCDEWVVIKNRDFITLKHVNRRDTKIRTHVQKIYKDLPYLFNSISQHDEYTLNGRHRKSVKHN